MPPSKVAIKASLPSITRAMAALRARLETCLRGHHEYVGQLFEQRAFLELLCLLPLDADVREGGRFPSAKSWGVAGHASSAPALVLARQIFVIKAVAWGASRAGDQPASVWRGLPTPEFHTSPAAILAGLANDVLSPALRCGQAGGSTYIVAAPPRPESPRRSRSRSARARSSAGPRWAAGCARSLSAAASASW